MRAKRLAVLAWSATVTGVLGLGVMAPAWAASAAPTGVTPTPSWGNVHSTTSTCKPDSYGSDACPKPTKTYTKPPTNTPSSTHTSSPPPSSSSSSKPPTTSQSTTSQPVVTPTSSAPATLPVTGPATTALVAAGSVLVLGGGVLVARTRRRKS